MGAAGVGGKAALLDEAAVAGLAVPRGFVVPDGAAPPAVGQRRRAPDIGPWAVRSAFSAEDGADESLAGWFETRLRVPPDEIADAVRLVRRSADRRPGSFRRDVLVMVMVDATCAGVAFSEPETYDDRVNVARGTAERLVAGREEGDALLLPRLERASEGWPRRLQSLLRRVRRTFGDRAWDVEWADDGDTCWLVQLRPVTAPTRRNEAFTIANHAEILPPLPSQLMASVIAEAGPELFGWYRRHDRSLPSRRPFLEVVAGRPFINLTLLEDLLRHLGLPTRLVADSIGGPPEHDHPARPARMLRTSPALVGMGVAQIRAVARARAVERRLASIGSEPAPTFAAALTQLREAYVGLVTGMFPLSSAIGPPLAMLRRVGTLVEHAARHRTITTQLADELDAVRRSPDPSAETDFLALFGHRGVYESDIARPRYRDDPSSLGTATATVGGPGSPPRRTLKGVLTAPVWWLARPPLAARERLRHEAMVGFAEVRDSLVRLAREAVVHGRLPTVEHLWLLDVDEARALDEGWTPDEAFWADRRAERQRLAALDPPPIVHRFDDPADWADTPAAGDRLTGLSLTDGVVQGRAWVLREPSTELPAGFEPSSTVLVARSVDAGWIPTLALVAAAAVEIGGDLSHGSILLRERGMPAITNVRGVTAAVETGDRLGLRAGVGVIERRDVDVDERTGT